MSLFSPRSFAKNVSPGGAISDLITVFRDAGRNRWLFMIPAAMVTTGIFSVMAAEGGRGPPRQHKIIYISTFRPDRTEAEIISSNITNQKRKEAEAVALAKRAEDVRQMYKTLGRMSGMDVDAIEKQAKADQEADDRAAAAAVAAGQPVSPARP